MINYSSAQEAQFGILDQQAPDWQIDKWIDGKGKSTAIKKQDYDGKVIVMLCYQQWCPGCHKFGFPTLKYLVDRYKNNSDVAFVAIQTVFEGKHVNTAKKLRKAQKEYDLEIPFGHDDGSQVGLDYSNIMKNYHTRGTPWIIIIDTRGKVVYNDFHVEPKQAIRAIKTSLAESN